VHIATCDVIAKFAWFGRFILSATEFWIRASSRIPVRVGQTAVEVELAHGFDGFGLSRPTGRVAASIGTGGQ
jgi:hypothetical protein